MQPAPQASSAAARKLVPFAEAAAFFDSLRQAGRKIVQSHGVFDLIHPGHICHLEEARTFGDVLVVTLTTDRHVRKGPGRPCFNEQLRARSLAALACVDHVVLVPDDSALAAIGSVRPDIYCKGKEYEEPGYDLTGGIDEERAAVERLGGQVRFAGPIKLSSTRLLNHYFDHLSGPVRAFCSSLASQFTRRDFHDAIECLRSLKVLVVGDTIFDRYTYVKVQGLTSKNLILSGRFLSDETQCGGALAVFRHVREFVDDVRFFSLTGAEPWVQEALAAHVPAGADRVVRDPGFTSIVKQRFVEPLAEGKEMKKFFAVNYLDAGAPGPAVQERLLTRLREELRGVDVVLLADFGHGMMQSDLRACAQDSAPFLALNCQTNSNNHGFNILTRQYQRADAFSLDEQELVLACGRRQPDFKTELDALRRQFRARYAWLTRGAVETLGLTEGAEGCACPPLECEVVDTIGAGDAFFSVASLAAARQLPVPLATFLAQLAGAQAVKIVGNSRPISKRTLVQGGMSLLNF